MAKQANGEGKVNYDKILKEQHLELKNSVDKYVAGEIQYPGLKKVSAGFGIYATKDGRFMTRVRQVGGEFTATKLGLLADIMDRNCVAFAHISTRDSIQLHGVPAERIYDIVRTCTENGMPFKGGGGDTYRNPLVSPLSGISSDTVFDVRPHALKLDSYIKTYEKAFKFGRKFKISFSGEAEDRGHAAVNDMGFLAKVNSGEKGFEVYTGGGLGRGPAMGRVLFDFLPESECIRAVIAMVDLFYEHGERENRSKARLRFLVEKLGFEEFKKLYIDYFNKTQVPVEYTNFEETNHSKIIANLKTLSVKETFDRDYLDWKKAAVSETKYQDVCSVRIFIKEGNLESGQFRSLVEILEETGCPFVRLTLEQDIYIPLIHKSFLPELYRLLKIKLVGYGVADVDFEDRAVTCIGAKVCGIGLLDSPEIGRDIFKGVEELFEKYPGYKADLFTEIIDGIKISGCGSSCGGNQVAALGFEGIKKMIDGKLTDCLQVYSGGRVDADVKALGKTASDRFITASEAPKYVSEVVESYINKLKKGEDLSFKQYMQKI